MSDELKAAIKRLAEAIPEHDHLDELCEWPKRPTEDIYSREADLNYEIRELLYTHRHEIFAAIRDAA